MPRLRIGVDTSGAEKVAKLAKDLDLLAKSSDAAAKGTEKTNTAYKTLAQGINAISGKFSKLNKEFDDVQRAANLAAGGIVAFNNALTGAGSGSKLGSGLKQVVGDMQALSAAAVVARTEMYALMETSGQYATIAKKNAGATYEQNLAMRAQLLATQQLYGLEERYVATKAKQILMDEAGAQALSAKTAAVQAQVAAYGKLQTMGITPTAGGDHVNQYDAANKSIAAQEQGLRALQLQMDKLNATRAGLKQGAYASEMLLENKSIAAQEQGLRALQLQMDKLNATRAGLKQGAYASEMLLENKSIAAQEQGLRALQLQMDKLNATRAGLKQGAYASEMLLENKSIAAQEQGLRALQLQMDKLNATRAGLKQGAYASEMLLENKSIAAQEQGLRALQLQMDKLNATRAGLKQGAYASEMLLENKSIAAQEQGLRALQLQMDKLNATRAGLKQGAYASEMLLENKSIAAQEQGLRALQLQMDKLNATRAGLKQGAYASEMLLENKSIAAQEQGLRALQLQMDKLNATRAGLKQGAYASEMLLENKSIAAQEQGLRALQLQMDKLNATRAGLKQGAYASEMRTESVRSGLGQGSNVAQMASESALYDDKGRLKYSIKNMKDYESAMRQAADGVDELAGKTGAAHGTIGKFGAGASNATKGVKALHDAARGASGAMGSLWMTYGQMAPLLAGFAAVGGTMATITKGADLDYTTRSIELLAYGFDTLSKNSELASVSLEGTKQAILGITDTPFSAGELGKGILELSRAGYTDLTANLKNIDQASKFAYIGQMDLAQAVELVVGQMSAFKEIGKDAGPALNTMAVVADKTSVSLQQMAEAFKNTTSLGTVMGIRFDDIAVALGVLGQAGIRGATAGAALNTMMYKLIAPTATAQKKMADLGVEFEAFDKKTGQIKSIKAIAFELANLTKNLNPNQVAAVFESMVGLRGVKALGALVQMAKQSADKFDELSKAVENSGTYLDGYYKLLEKSGKFQIDLLKSEFDKLFTANYDNASVVSAIKSLREVVNSDGVKSALASITSLIIGLTSAAAKMISLDPAAFAGGLGIIGILIGSNPITAAVATALAAMMKIKEFIDWYNKSDLNKIDFAAGVTAEFGGDTSWADQAKKDAIEVEQAAKSAASAKTELAKLAGIDLDKPVETAADVDKLAKVEDYFNRIQDKIIDINRTPLEIVNANVEKDIAEMWEVLAGSGEGPKKQAEIAAAYVKQLENVGKESQTAAGKIELLQAQMDNASDDNDKQWFGSIIDSLKKLSEMSRKKEFEKANKEMLASLRKEWQAYADKVIELQDKIAGTQRTLAEDLRSIDQSNMDGLTLWRDKKKEAEEYAEAAKKAGAESLAAFAKGDSVTGQSQFALAEEQMKKAVEAAKALNTEVKDSAGQTLLTKPQGAEEAKKFLKEFAAEQVKLDKAVQDAYKGQMDGIQGKAGGADMTEGMDDAKAKWITNWMDMKTASTQNMASAADEIQTKMDTINFPTQRWRESIFNMKGMFVEAADEMSRRLEAEGNYSGTGKRATNAQPTSKYVEELKKIEAEVEAARDKASKPIDTQVQVNAVDAAAAMGQAIKQGGAAAAVEISKAQTSAIATAKVTTPVVQKGTGLMTGFGGGLEPERIAAINTQLADTARYVSLLANSGASLEGALDIPQVQKEVDIFKAELERARAAYEAVQNSINNAPEGQYSLDQKLEVANTLDSLQQAQLEIVKIQETVKAAAPLSKYLDSEAAATEAEALQTAIKDIVDAFSATGIDLGITKDIEEVKETSTDMLKVWKEGWEGTSDYAVERVDYIHDALKDLVNKDWTVKVNVEEARHLGGMLGGYHNGGMIQALAAGGGVKNVLQGAYLPGFGGGDRRLLLGEDGEVMLNKFAVAKGTPQTALAYNRGDFRTVVNDLVTRFPGLLPGYAGGGMMGESPSPAAVGAPNAQTPGYSASFTFTDTSGQQGKVFGSETDIKLLERAINKHNRFRSSNK